MEYSGWLMLKQRFIVIYLPAMILLAGTNANGVGCLMAPVAHRITPVNVDLYIYIYYIYRFCPVSNIISSCHITITGRNTKSTKINYVNKRSIQKTKLNRAIDKERERDGKMKEKKNQFAFEHYNDSFPKIVFCSNNNKYATASLYKYIQNTKWSQNILNRKMYISKENANRLEFVECWILEKITMLCSVMYCMRSVCVFVAVFPRSLLLDAVRYFICIYLYIYFFTFCFLELLTRSSWKSFFLLSATFYKYKYIINILPVVNGTAHHFVVKAISLGWIIGVGNFLFVLFLAHIHLATWIRFFRSERIICQLDKKHPTLIPNRS